MSFDPLPPKDSVNVYERPLPATVVNNSSNPLLMFLGSLMPDFNPNQPVAPVPEGSAPTFKIEYRFFIEIDFLGPD